MIFLSFNQINVKTAKSWAAVVHLNFRAGSTFLVPVCTVSPGHWVNKKTLNRTSRRNKVDAVRLNLLLLEGQGCVELI